MKKLLIVLLVCLLALSAAACQKEEKTAEAETKPVETKEEGPAKSTTLPTLLDTMEYTLYTNIFYNQTGDSYVGQTITKRGTFTTIQDSFNGVTRYYVWGYNDQTKCCDWQWEFVPKDASQLPARGSFVTMTGVFSKDEAALDGYWFTDAEIKTETVYVGPSCDVDMGTMSATLERVQIINMQVYPDEYEGKSVRIYGRIAGASSVQHPYYDNAWSQDFITAGEVPAIGKLVELSGVWQSGTVKGAMLKLTDAY